MTIDNPCAWRYLAGKLGSVLFALTICVSARGALYYDVNKAIPDGSIIGLTDAHTVTGLTTPISEVRVTLNISGGFNGDLYGYLRLNDSPLVVLVNRVGTTSGNSDGYPNLGMLVTLTSSLSDHDIHFYQDYSPGYNKSGQVTGTWAADGRTDPLGTERGSLSSFSGLDPNGTWTLFFADRSLGGSSTLVGWSLDITAVPEPVNAALGVFAALAGGIKLLGWRRKFQRRASAS